MEIKRSLLNYFYMFLILASFFFGTIYFLEEIWHEKNLNSKQIELKISNKTEILSEFGSLQTSGWSRSPENFHFDSSPINPRSSSWLTKHINSIIRYKKWEAMVFTSEKHVFCLAVFDLGYLGGYFVHIADIQDPSKEVFYKDEIFMTNKIPIAENCYSDCVSVNYTSNEIAMKKFFYQKQTNNTYLFKYEFRNEELSISIDTIFSRPSESESLTLLVPMSEDQTLFYFNVKQNVFTNEGFMRINDEDVNIENYLTSIDSGRGAWPIKSGWFWVNSNGHTDDGKTIGFNIGHGFYHEKASMCTEDIFTIDGKIFKLPSIEYRDMETHIEFFVGRKTKTENLTGNSCQFKFTTVKNKKNTKNLVVAQVNLRVRYGVFEGNCIDEEGNQYAFSKVYGLVENKKSVW